MEKYFSMSFKSISFVSYLVSCVLIAVGAVSEMLHIGLVYSPENMFLKKKKKMVICENVFFFLKTFGCCCR